MATPDTTPNPTPAPSMPDNMVQFMNSAVPIPSPEARQASINDVVAPDPVISVSQPPSFQAPSVPAPPMPPQPVPEQPQPQQPAPVAPQPQAPDLSQQLAEKNALIAQYEAQQTLYNQQRAQLEEQARTTAMQQAETTARQYALQEYRKYVAAGVPDAQAQEWANANANTIYQAATYTHQQQQAQTRTQEIARRHNVSPSDIPSGMSEQAMESYAQLLSRLNRIEQSSQTAQTAQLQTQEFDSNIGAAAGMDPAAEFFNRVGDPTRVASTQDLQQMNEYIRQNFPNL